MSSLTDSQLEQLAQQLRVSTDGLAAAAKLFDDGYSVPFVARYRKQGTGDLDERHLRRIHHAWSEAKSANTSKNALKQLLEERGQLSSESAQQIDVCHSAAQLSNWLSLHKRRKLPKAVMEQRRGWYPLAHRVLDASVTPDELETELAKLVEANEHLESAIAAKELLFETLAELIAYRPTVRIALARIIEESASVACGPFVEDDCGDVSTPIDKPNASNEASIDSTVVEAAPDQSAAPANVAAATTDSAANKSSADSVVAPADSPTKPVEEPAKKKELEDRREKRRSARRQKRSQLEAKFKHLIGLKSKFADLKNEQLLELDFGDRVRAIAFNLECDEAPLYEACEAQLPLEGNVHVSLIKEAAAAAVKDRLIPELLKEAKRDLCSRAANELRGPLAHSLRARALQRPLRARLLALHSKLRWGWQAAIVDADGTVVALESIPWNQGSDGDQALTQRLRELASKHQAELIVLDDSAGAKKLHRLFDSSKVDNALRHVTVDTSGLMDFVRSATANDLFDESDPHSRAAIAIAWRILDPLTVLSSLPSKDLYSTQPELKTFLLLNEMTLRDELDSCLCLVGVDVNKAPVVVLQRIPGIDNRTAKQIVAHRANKPFANRAEVQELIADKKSAEEAMGFLLVMNGDNPLDATSVHPSHYAWADSVMEACQLTRDNLAATVQSRMAVLGKIDPSPADDAKWSDGLRSVPLRELAEKTGAHLGQLKQMLIALRHAGNDIRRNSAGPVIRGKQVSLSELTAGKELDGVVMNIVDFGVFVDVGQAETGLVHISRLANGFIRNARDFVWEGDPIRVWVVSIDEEKNRLALSAVAPGSETSRRTESQAASRRRPARRSSEKTAFQGKREKGSRRKPAHVPARKKPPKVVAPITDGMKTGSEPMRAFSDLLQFYDKKKDGKKK